MWLATLLVFVLSGFGATICRLQHQSQLHQIDAELERRMAVLSGSVGAAPSAPNSAPLHEERKMAFEPRDLPRSPELSSLFDRTRANAF